MNELALKKMEQASQAIQIRSVIENIKHMPFIPAEMKEKINKELPEFLPVLKDLVNTKLYEISQKLGSGADKKIYVLKNGKNGAEFTIWKNMRAFDGDKEVSFPLHKIMDRIEKCDTIETLIAEVLSFKIFSPDEEAKP